MTTYRTKFSDGEEITVDVPTGDYRMVVAMVAAMKPSELPCAVQIWCDELIPDYGPYWYRLKNDANGNLVVSAGI